MIDEQFIIPQIVIPKPQQFNVDGGGIMPTVMSNAKNQIMGLMFGIGIKAAKIVDEFTFGKFNDSGFERQVNGYTPDVDYADNGGVAYDGAMSSVFADMPVMCHLTLLGNTYTALDGSQITFPTIDFETVLISLKLNKTIEKTKIFGRSGSVKESICMDDWDVEIRAIITANAPVSKGLPVASNPIGVYPYSNMEAIMKMLKAPVAIKTDCWFLNHLAEIEYIVIESVQIEQIEGGYSEQRLVISACSDTPLIINLNPNA